MKKLLFVSRNVPYPLNNGDKIRSYHLLKALSKKYEVYLLAYSSNLSKYASKDLSFITKIYTIDFSRFKGMLNLWQTPIKEQPLHVAYYKNNKFEDKIHKIINQHDIDVLYCFRINMVQYGMSIDSNMEIVLDLTDCSEMNYRQRISNKRSLNNLYLKYECNKMAHYEEQVINSNKKVVLCAHNDAVAIAKRSKGNVPYIIPNIVNFDYFKYNESICEMPFFLFVGTMDYVPNVIACKNFAKNIFPRILEVIPNAQFYIVGRNPAKEIKNLDNEENIIVTGEVEDIRKYLKKAAIFVAPITIATGTQNKVLQAIAAGIPVVTFNIIEEALCLGDNSGISSASDECDFANICIDLMNNIGKREKNRELAYLKIKKEYTQDALEKKLSSLLL